MTAAATESVRHSRAIETGGFGCRFLFGVFSAKWKRPRKTGLAEKADLFERYAASFGARACTRWFSPATDLTTFMSCQS
jgi:hypothetical protein